MRRSNRAAGGPGIGQGGSEAAVKPGTGAHAAVPMHVARSVLRMPSHAEPARREIGLGLDQPRPPHRSPARSELSPIACVGSNTPAAVFIYLAEYVSPDGQVRSHDDRRTGVGDQTRPFVPSANLRK